MKQGIQKYVLGLLVSVLWVWNSACAAPVASWTTDQGARVYFIETHALPIVDVQVLFLAGSAFDPADKPGVASLMASLMDQVQHHALQAQRDQTALRHSQAKIDATIAELKEERDAVKDLIPA